LYATAFDYVRAHSWTEAVERLVEGGEDARVIAGGQSLVPMMTLRLADPSVLVDIGGATERSIERRNGTLVLSALVRHVDLEHSGTVRASCPMLAEAAGMIGNVRVRHRGTIGGSLAHGDATAELPCVAVAMGATVQITGPLGERSMAVRDLLVTHLTTSLEPGEVITRVEVPALVVGQGSAFVEMARRPGDFAIVEVAAVVTLGGGGRLTDARIVVGATSDRPADMSALAEPLHGEPPSEHLTSEVAGAVAAEARVGSSTHGGAEYRRDMIAVLVKRALLIAATRAQKAHGPGDDGR
jgi:CO/xanthine dehydrogenase FAD-binding subunit